MGALRKEIDYLFHRGVTLGITSSRPVKVSTYVTAKQAVPTQGGSGHMKLTYQQLKGQGWSPHRSEA